MCSGACHEGNVDGGAGMDIQICVGSSCHMKGSYPIIKLFEGWIATYGLEDKVQLRAAFCLGDCTRGVAMRIDGKPVTGLTVQNAEDVFQRYVLQQKGEEGTS
jgi:NADH:ubiquinone oxidoreductase subunit E